MYVLFSANAEPADVDSLSAVVLHRTVDQGCIAEKTFQGTKKNITTRPDRQHGWLCVSVGRTHKWWLQQLCEHRLENVETQINTIHNTWFAWHYQLIRLIVYAAPIYLQKQLQSVSYCKYRTYHLKLTSQKTIFGVSNSWSIGWIAASGCHLVSCADVITLPVNLLKYNKMVDLQFFESQLARDDRIIVLTKCVPTSYIISRPYKYDILTSLL